MRATVSDIKHPVYSSTMLVGFTADLRSVMNYYSFACLAFGEGMEMPGRRYSGEEYRWGFQAQEAENEIAGNGNYSFFKYRISDNRLGRFFALDPLSPEYPWNSPYAFSENRVIDGVELEGLEVNLINEEKNPDLFAAATNIRISNVIHVYAHGSEKRLIDDRKPKGTKGRHIKTPTEFDNMMNEESEVWRNRQNSDKPIVVILHSCRTSPFAEMLSIAFPDVVFVASDYKVFAKKENGSGTYPDENAEKYNNQRQANIGIWNVYWIGEKKGEYYGRIKPDYFDDIPDANVPIDKSNSNYDEKE